MKHLGVSGKWLAIILLPVLLLGGIIWSIASSASELPPSEPAVYKQTVNQKTENTTPVNTPTTARSSTQPSTNSAPRQSVTSTPQSPTPVAQDNAESERMRAQSEEYARKAKEAQCASLSSKNELAVLEENARHTRAIDAINTEYRSRGLGYSGMYQAAIDQENQRHSGNVSNIRSNHASSVATYGC